MQFSTESRDALAREAKQKGFNMDYLVKTGLCYTRDDGQLRDRFWGRVIFPVHTLSGKVVAFGGRILKSDTKVAKYVNSPESEIYHKSRELYGIYFAKQAIVKQDKCFLVEGYTDVTSMHQAGVENVVASSGTALTSGHIRMIHRFTNNITVLYDGDWAGIKASLRGIDMLLEEGMNIKVMLLPDGEDPDSFARKHNATEFQEYIAANEVDFIRFKTNLLMDDAKGDPYKRSQVIKDIVESIAVIPEAIVRSEYIKECSQMLHIEERILVNEVAKLKKTKEATPRSSSANATATESTTTDGATSPASDSSIDVPLPTEEHMSVPASASDIAEAIAPSAPLPEWNDEHGVLYSKELLIVKQLIRHGEKLVQANDASSQEMTVTEYVVQELILDGATFSTPIFAEVLRELQQHHHEEGFIAERYFITHANPELSRLAVDLVEEKYQLSKYHSKTQTVVSDESRLLDLMSHLVVDYKHSLIEIDLKKTLDLLRQPDIMADPKRCEDVMSRYMSLVEIKQHLAKHLGDRVIG